MAGVLAIGLHATGASGNFYSEVNEYIDMRPLEGGKAAGGSWFDQIRYGAVPQVLPNIVSYKLLRFEINVVTRDVAPYTVVGGVPARFLKRRFQRSRPKLCKRLRYGIGIGQRIRPLCLLSGRSTSMRSSKSIASWWPCPL